VAAFGMVGSVKHLRQPSFRTLNYMECRSIVQHVLQRLAAVLDKDVRSLGTSE
jgi:hypothetical protein